MFLRHSVHWYDPTTNISNKQLLRYQQKMVFKTRCLGSLQWHDTVGLGDRKGIRPVKNRLVVYCSGYLPRVRCRLEYCAADATATATLCLLLH